MWHPLYCKQLQCKYLDELQSQLTTDQDVNVSISTISCTVQKLALSHKYMSKAALGRNKLFCVTWQPEYGDIPADLLCLIG